MPTISGTIYDDTGAPAVGRIVRAYRRDTGALLADTVTSDGSAPLLDAHWSSVSLLMPMDGANGSTTFTDIKGANVSVLGNAQISTAQSKFGGASAYFDGAGDALKIAVSAAFGFGSGDLTIESFVRGDVTQTQSYPVIVGADLAWGTGAWTLQLNHASAPGKISLYAFSKNGAILTGVTDIRDATWHHVAITRQGNTWRLFIDGVQNASATFTGALNGTTGKLAIGGGAASTEAMKGYIDDLRITKGVARYTADFSPPAIPCPTSEYGAAPAVGSYAISTSYTGEIQRIVLDDTAGTLYNDLIDRVILA
jgi:hypothetical protein